MDIIENIALFVVGIYILMKAADLFVDQASLIARKLKISSLVIGLTIVALGTSLPEFAVSLSSALQPGSTGSELSLGNVVGSSIANITLILGISALMSPILVQKNILKRDLPIAIISAVALFLVAFFFQADQVIVWWEALILIVIMIVYVTILIVSSLRGSNGDLDVKLESDETREVEDKKFTVMTILLLLLGIAGIVVGAEMVTRPAKYLAEKMAIGLSIEPMMATNLVGVTVVAVGTSLPELATSIAASRKKENGIVLGNILGSNILNIVFILGFSGLVIPLGVSQTMIIDMIIMIAITLIAGFLILRKKLSKVEGLILLALFMSYVTYVVIRTIF